MENNVKRWRVTVMLHENDEVIVAAENCTVVDGDLIFTKNTDLVKIVACGVWSEVSLVEPGTPTENKAAIPEPQPVPGQTVIYPLVIEDIKARVEAGKEKYGTVLESHNGRNALMDAYQETIDLALYLRQAIEECGDSE